MQIYNEEVNDLLAPESVKLPVHESKENGPYVCGLREDIVISPEQVRAQAQMHACMHAEGRQAAWVAPILQGSTKFHHASASWNA